MLRNHIIMELHGDYIICVCGMSLAFLEHLKRQRGRGSYFNISKSDIFQPQYHIFECKKGRKVLCVYSGNYIGKRRSNSKDIILIPSKKLKQGKNAVYIRKLKI